MEKFEFSSQSSGDTHPIFSGDMFYNVYKDAEFLRHSNNVEMLLSKGYELRLKLKNMKPGACIPVNNMMLERNTPLFVKKTGPGVEVEAFEFTANRLMGLTAAYAFDNRLRFPILESTEAKALGLTWENENVEKCRLFLAAVSGTEHFYSQFQFFPLLCALNKLQLKKITLEPVIKIARIKNPSGVRMGKDMMSNLIVVSKLWSNFPGSSSIDLKKQLQTLPPELKKVLISAD